MKPKTNQCDSGKVKKIVSKSKKKFSMIKKKKKFELNIYKIKKPFHSEAIYLVRL